MPRRSLCSCSTIEEIEEENRKLKIENEKREKRFAAVFAHRLKQRLVQNIKLSSNSRMYRRNNKSFCEPATSQYSSGTITFYKLPKEIWSEVDIEGNIENVLEHETLHMLLIRIGESDACYALDVITPSRIISFLEIVDTLLKMR